jgi:hypothetical protein
LKDGRDGDNFEDFLEQYPNAETVALKRAYKSKLGIKAHIRHGEIDGFGFVVVIAPVGIKPSDVRAVFEEVTGKSGDEISETNGFNIFPFTATRRS